MCNKFFLLRGIKVELHYEDIAGFAAMKITLCLSDTLLHQGKKKTTEYKELKLKMYLVTRGFVNIQALINEVRLYNNNCI